MSLIKKCATYLAFSLLFVVNAQADNAELIKKGEKIYNTNTKVTV